MHINEQLVAGWTKAMLYKHQCLKARGNRLQHKLDLVEVDVVEGLKFIKSVSSLFVDREQDTYYPPYEDIEYS